MSYQVLARKWRPKSFKEMVGQEHVLRMLSNALDNNRLHHAYLFTGTRGVGKTSLGRIFAKCLNCEKGTQSQPCGTCTICQAIDGGRFLDLLEIDAASRTKVEDTRDLLDNVQYAPTTGRYKIYLIDEVHMLSGHSFNALLKTLEEPPSHVIFILATTDPKKLPITILSRCLQFHLKRVPEELISQQLQRICAAENIAFAKEGLDLLAHAADGSMRDALSLLDQAIAYGNTSIQTADVRAMLGTLQQDFVVRLLKALKEKNGEKLLTEIAHLQESAPQYDQALEELITTLHSIAVQQVVPNARAISSELQQLARNFSAEEIQLYYQIALIGRRDLGLAPNPALGFEMVLLRMLAFKPGNETTPAKTTKPTAQTVTPPKNSEAPVDEWHALLTKLSLTGMAQALALNCTLQKITEQEVTLVLSESHQPMLNAKSTERIEQALSAHFNRPLKVKIQTTTTELNSPAKQQHDLQQSRKASAVAAIQQDDTVQKMMEMFGATVTTDSIEPTEK